MRRRELLIAAGVLVPFAALVAVGFHFSDAPAPAPGEHGVNAPARPPPPTVVTSALPPARVEVDAGAAAGPAAPPLPRALAAPITAVLPEVQRCFEDQRLRVRHDVRIHFTPTPDGGFERVRVDENNNPYLAACLEDVFSEVAFSPSGAETFTPAEYTFRFEPPGATP
jgi:hypothetical protein